jgi:hypothetical protein
MLDRKYQEIPLVLDRNGQVLLTVADTHVRSGNARQTTQPPPPQNLKSTSRRSPHPVQEYIDESDYNAIQVSSPLLNCNFFTYNTVADKLNSSGAS